MTEQFTAIPATANLNDIVRFAGDIARNAAKAEAFRLCGHEKNHADYHGWALYSLTQAASAFGYTLTKKD